MLQTILAPSALCVVAAAVAMLGCGGTAPAAVENSAPNPAAETAPYPGLPRVSDLPTGYEPVGDLAGRGMLYAAGGHASARTHDGDHVHGYDAPLVWAEEGAAIRTEGVVYRATDGAIVAAGYLLPQADLATSKSFHGLTLRELDFPAPRSMTVDFLEGDTDDTNRYLLLWHFASSKDDMPVGLPSGELPPLTTLPDRFTVFACDQFAEVFCPGMGRHYTDLTRPAGRQPDSSGDDGVIYGEAAGKLIFIEYVLGQEELAAGVSWPAMPLDNLPIPPIDNVHVLHFGDPETHDGRYTVHMYFLPEDIYLHWETEPDQL